MAADTNKELRNKMIYQVFVRNFSKQGTFAAVREKLDDIRALGTDIIWFMPIHPIGKLKRKGNLGSPYAISDYRAVNPEFGTLEDFVSLVSAIHEKGMKCMIDVVYNHTSPDSLLSREHPEWFYHKPDGSFGNRVGDWSDIIDLDYSNKALWDYQIETLCYWAGYVDGFRCDVGPMIPIEFWEKARKEVAKIRPDCIWLSESVEPEFIVYLRSQGIIAHADCEMYRAFDICYDYDIYPDFKGIFNGSGSLEKYLCAVNRQEYIYPENYVKLNFLENHDQTRAAFFIPDPRSLRSWTAFMFFRKGTALVYAGQEKGTAHLPDLFDKDTVCFDDKNGTDLTGLIAALSGIKKDALFTDSVYSAKAAGDSFIVAVHKGKNEKAVGIFPVRGETASVPVGLEDGEYIDRISGGKTEVLRGMTRCQGEPVILFSSDRQSAVKNA